MKRQSRTLIIFSLIAIGLFGALAALSHVAAPIQTLPDALRQHLGPPEMSKVDPDKPLREQTRIFEIAGRRFEIPIMYIDGRPKPGEHQDSMLLEIIWPEMRSIWELESRAEYERVRKDEHRLGWILLEPTAIRPSLDQQISNLERRLTKKEHLGTKSGLEVDLHYHGQETEPEIWREVHLGRNSEGRIVDFISCHPDERIAFPRCNHRFIESGLLYNISYNKQGFFPQWREQRQRAIDFIHSLEIYPKPN